MVILFFFLSMLITSCSSEQVKGYNNLNEIKKDFIDTILLESFLDEGPFEMNYQLKTVLFSDNIVSLLGEIFVYAHLPHGWLRYEGKTFVKMNGIFKEITLDNLFPKSSQKEFLRRYCEEYCKNTFVNGSYFQGEDPLCNDLDLELIKTFVVDRESLIIVFQPYEVGGFADGPFVVKIPFNELMGKWQVGNILEKQLPIATNFLSSWEEENWVYDIQT